MDIRLVQDNPWFTYVYKRIKKKWVTVGYLKQEENEAYPAYSVFKSSDEGYTYIGTAYFQEALGLLGFQFMVKEQR